MEANELKERQLLTGEDSHVALPGTRAPEHQPRESRVCPQCSCQGHGWGQLVLLSCPAPCEHAGLCQKDGFVQLKPRELGHCGPVSLHFSHGCQSSGERGTSSCTSKPEWKGQHHLMLFMQEFHVTSGHSPTVGDSGRLAGIWTSTPGLLEYALHVVCEQ